MKEVSLPITTNPSNELTRSSRRLSGWALILGASSGFGAATARSLAEAGMNIFGVHFDRKSTMPMVRSLEDEINRLGRQTRFFNANAAEETNRKEIVASIRRELSDAGQRNLRVLLHSLAFGTLLPFISTSQSVKKVAQVQVEMTLDVMANSLIYWTQDLHEAGLLADGSRILAMTSEGSRRVWSQYGPVSAAKSALESHIRQLAMELAPEGITVNAISAGVTDTPSLRKIPGHEKIISSALERNPHGRLTTPEDVAKALTALCAPECYWLTGNTINIDGGEHLS